MFTFKVALSRIRKQFKRALIFLCISWGAYQKFNSKPKVWLLNVTVFSEPIASLEPPSPLTISLHIKISLVHSSPCSHSPFHSSSELASLVSLSTHLPDAVFKNHNNMATHSDLFLQETRWEKLHKLRQRKEGSKIGIML